MGLRDELLPLVENLRAIPGELGFRQFSVFIRTTKWTGARVGLGTPTVSTVQLLVGGQNPKVRQVRQKDVVAGSDEFQNALWEIGPVTPTFSGGGYSADDLGPINDGTPTTMEYILKGPGMPASGLLCVKYDDSNDRSLRHTVRVKSTGRAA